MTWSEMKQGLYFLHMYLQINGHKQFPQLDLVQKKKKYTSQLTQTGSTSPTIAM